MVSPFGVTFEMSCTSVSVSFTGNRGRTDSEGMNYNQRRRTMQSALSATRQQEMSILDSSSRNHWIYLQQGWREEVRRSVGCPSR